MTPAKVKTFLKFFIPFGIWCVLFEPVLRGGAVISSETLHIYSVVKFYLDNLKLGVFPLWEPFISWGEPTQIYFNYAGIFNPIWLAIPVLDSLGFTFYQAFVVVVSAYFWIGLWGFYVLAKIVLKDHAAAYFAFLLVLFSSVSMALFAQFHTPLLYVPAVWFFYFLISFFQAPTKTSLAGLTLTAAIILISYLPFYFFTVFIILIGSLGLVYYSMVKTVVSQTLQFVRVNIMPVVLSLAVVGLAFMPGYLAYQSTLNREVVAPFRNGNIDKKVGVDLLITAGSPKMVWQAGWMPRIYIQTLI